MGTGIQRFQYVLMPDHARYNEFGLFFDLINLRYGMVQFPMFSLAQLSFNASAVVILPGSTHITKPTKRLTT